MPRRIVSRLILPALLIGLALPAMARVDKIAGIDVTFDPSAVTNAAAAKRFTHIADDLKNAIAGLVADRLGDEGARIGIDISEVELSNSFTEATGAADTRLEGIVAITDAQDNSNFAAYVLTVNIDQARGFLPETVDMTTLTASGDAYYQAMIMAFARSVVDRLDL
ncbi:hypothetical protein NX862_01960 [Rhodobacter sp. KR11]|uniref:hypothetical protein n=1 Tax=Rhodobacter sp. KR11 TaxID=2974588 RepID=UPI0022213D2F|nr:hypothetical protein [Rhodobacter sp. KR11]MCW1917510.1 hypothetical protein [Rhodobacter sp. KR11]